MSGHVEYWEKAIPWRYSGENKSYEERRKMRYDLQDYMKEVIGFERYRGKRVLEIGSGSGIDSAEFARSGAEVVSLDFTNTGTQSTRNLFKEASMPHNATRASAYSLPFKTGSFDCVYSFGVLHHIPEVDPVIADIVRVLKPGGELLCMLYNRDSLLYAYSILFAHKAEGLTEEQLVSRYSERILGCPYTKAYTKADAAKLVSQFFDPISVSVHFNVIDVQDVRKLKVDVPDRFELGWHIIVRARRR